MIEALDRVKMILDDRNITACDYAYEIDGVLKEQAYYYIDSFSEITQKISEKGNTIMQALTQ